MSQSDQVLFIFLTERYRLSKGAFPLQRQICTQCGNATTPLLWGLSNLGKSTPLNTMFTPCLHFVFFSSSLLSLRCFQSRHCAFPLPHNEKRRASVFYSFLWNLSLNARMVHYGIENGKEKSLTMAESVKNVWVFLDNANIKRKMNTRLNANRVNCFQRRVLQKMTRPKAKALQRCQRH